MRVYNTIKKESGFTLMELLVTVILVAVLASYSVYYYNNTIDEGKLHAAKGKLAALGGAVERYKIENSGKIDRCLAVALSESEMNKSCGSGNSTLDRAYDIFRCGYAEKSLGFDDNFTFYLGCPSNCGVSGTFGGEDTTAYMKPKEEGNSIFPTCAYFDADSDKVIEVKE